MNILNHGTSDKNDWLLSYDLGLVGEFVLEWDNHIKRLNHCGIRLSDQHDEIVWL